MSEENNEFNSQKLGSIDYDQYRAKHGHVSDTWFKKNIKNWSQEQIDENNRLLEEDAKFEYKLEQLRYNGLGKDENEKG